MHDHEVELRVELLGELDREGKDLGGPDEHAGGVVVHGRGHGEGHGREVDLREYIQDVVTF